MQTEKARLWREILNKEMEEGRLHGIEEIVEAVEDCGVSTSGLKTFLNKQRGLSRCAHDTWIRTKELK